MKTSCDSWLEHIYQKKIKFSEGGAKKLAADFAFFRQWVEGKMNSPTYCGSGPDAEAFRNENISIK